MSTTNSTQAWLDARRQESRGPELIAAISVCPSIAAICVAMRVYTRVFFTKKYFLEDYSIVAALVRRVAHRLRWVL